MNDGRLNDARADRITGAVGTALSLSYIAYARGIEDSLLADGVGANGVPIGVGVVLLLASLALLAKTWVVKASTPNVQEIVKNDAAATPDTDAPQHPHGMALGLLAILAVYVTLLPLLGYALSISLLVGAVAWFAGARQRTSLLACMLLAGPLLWLLFDWALEIRLPIGLWPKLWGR